MKSPTLRQLALERIVAAEIRYNDLLPVERLKGHPSTELVSAARAWSEEVWAAAEQLEPLTLSAEQVRQGLLLAQNPVFICGTHRSGTTLVRDILDGHPDLVVLPAEGTYYTNIETQLKFIPQKEWAGHIGREWLRRLANPINQPPYWLLGRSNIAECPYINFARYLIAWWSILNGQMATQWPHMAVVLAYATCINNLSAKYWIDKTPTNERFLDRIRKEIPSAKIIQLIREPLATISSHKKMDPSWNFRHALYNLRKSFAIAHTESALANPAFLLLRYEDISNEPKKTIAKLALFLDIRLADIMTRPTVAGMPARANSSFNKQPAAGAILSPSSPPPDKLLSTAEQQQVSACLGKLSARHNYPLRKIGYFSRLYLSIKYRALSKF